MAENDSGQGEKIVDNQAAPAQAIGGSGNVSPIIPPPPPPVTLSQDGKAVSAGEPEIGSSSQAGIASFVTSKSIPRLGVPNAMMQAAALSTARSSSPGVDGGENLAEATASGFSDGVNAAMAAGHPSVMGAQRLAEMRDAGVQANEGPASLTEAERSDVAMRVLAAQPHLIAVPGAKTPAPVTSIADAPSLRGVSAAEREVLVEIDRELKDGSGANPVLSKVLADMPTPMIADAQEKIEIQRDAAHATELEANLTEENYESTTDEQRKRQRQFYSRYPELTPEGTSNLAPEVLDRHPELRPDPHRDDDLDAGMQR